MSQEITLDALHRKLAYRPGRRTLSIETFRNDDDLLVCIDHAAPVKIPAYVNLARMLAHYPAPVNCNGEPLELTPYRPEAGIAKSGYCGDIMDAQYQSRQPAAGPYQGVILLDGVLYGVGPCPDLEHDHRFHSVTTYRVPDHQDGQPHYARNSEYCIRPNYRLWNDAGAGYRFEFTRCGSSIQCQPSVEAYVALQPQRQRQDAAAAMLIRELTGVADLGAPTETNAYTYRRMPDVYLSSHGDPVGLISYGIPVTVDLKCDMANAASHSLTKALYRNPAPNLVPVAPREQAAVADVSCERITVVASDRQVIAVARAVSHHFDETAAGIPGLGDPQTGARSITAHLTVTEPGGNSREVDIPLDIFCDGEMYEESVWLTDAWQPEHIDELRQILVQAYYDAGDGENYRDLGAYQDEMTVLATRLLRGNRQGFQTELQQVCDRFYPANSRRGIAIATAANARNIITWQPAGPAAENPPPPWLTAAIAANRPELDDHAVRRQACEIWDDESHRERLLDCLLRPAPAA